MNFDDVEVTFPDDIERELWEEDNPGVPYPGAPRQENDADEVYEDEALHLEQPRPGSGESQSEKQARWRASATLHKMAKRDAQQVSKALLGFMEGIAVVALGPKASMLDYEREMIAEPLERILLRMDVVNAEFISKWSDPAVLIMLLGAYISRITKEKAEEEEPEAKPIKFKPKPEERPEKSASKPTGKNADAIITEQTVVPPVVKEGFQGTSMKL